MGKNIYLVSPNFIREMSNVSTNLQDKYILSAIREAQDINYREVVGGKLLKHLCELIDNGTIESDENQLFKEIVDLSKYFLTYLAVARICVISSFKIDNIGVNQTYDTNVQASNTSDIFHMEKHYLNIADSYCKRLQMFLKEHYSELKDFLKHTCYEQDANLKSSASTGIFLGGMRGKEYKCIK